MSSIVIVDLGTGNLRSVAKAMEHVAPGREVLIGHALAQIRAAGRLVLPGQGAIGTWMAQLTDQPLRAAVLDALSSRPVLGICLGLQALYHHSEENGGTPGLNLLPGQVRRFPAGLTENGERLKIPHMGWNTVRQTRPHPLWEGIPDNERFYFVHSYYADSGDPAVVAGECAYGLTFTAAAAKENLFAVQFHPEKSQHAGLRLLENFVRWDGTP